MQEVARHTCADDLWIVVGGNVYDVSQHLVEHPGWQTPGGISTPLSILAHGGTDCTREFHAIHRSYPRALKELPMYFIGEIEK